MPRFDERLSPPDASERALRAALVVAAAAGTVRPVAQQIAVCLAADRPPKQPDVLDEALPV